MPEEALDECAAVDRRDDPCGTSTGSRARNEHCAAPGLPASEMRADDTRPPAHSKWHRSALRVVELREIRRWLPRNVVAANVRSREMESTRADSASEFVGRENDGLRRGRTAPARVHKDCHSGVETHRARHTRRAVDPTK